MSHHSSFPHVSRREYERKYERAVEIARNAERDYKNADENEKYRLLCEVENAHRRVAEYESFAELAF